eukprot:TRINITY_DN7953_c0_g1_i2.p2 TRINITY_DN7953_c0_g1~~TRINITY_DN7953_c0_g1_i2.p2  ORF type:complete len:167 (-),score=47.89 TRINITY_DN7953_c0_g1_i2:11-511(-)
MMFTPDPPFVLKIGSAEAGYGKMKFDTTENLVDFRGCLALHKDYVTIEQYVGKREYDIRVQKIGNHFRAYKRTSANWKGNVGSSILEEIPMTETFQFWIDQTSQLFGGMDIMTVDAIHCTDGTDVILEINDTASGFAPTNEKEDMGFVRDLVLERLEALYPTPHHT